MNILLVSDNHNESRLKPYIPDIVFYGNYDVLVIAGDFDSYHGIKNGSLASICEAAFDKPVIFIAGNHEYYSNIKTLEEINDIFKEIESSIDNLTILNNTECMIQGVRFYGGTMWSSLNTKEPEIRYGDESAIHFNDGSRMVPDKMREQHQLFVEGYKQFIKKESQEKRVVISHFPPLKELWNPRFKEEKPINAYFYADMSKYILNDNAPNAWFYGHNHYSQEITVGNTLVASSQIGFSLKENGFKIFTI